GYFCKIETRAGAVFLFLLGTFLSALAVALIIIKYGVFDGKLWGARRNREEVPDQQQSSSALESREGQQSKTSVGSKAPTLESKTSTVRSREDLQSKAA
ncbi:MAG: hypothetical protein QWI73_06210, partial [Alphaproteobacteria bacterium]|nr:hypothetical protein [Alphaproteobacteria bacterium]